MALNAFLVVDGIKGSARQKGREGKVTVIGVDHEIKASPDPKSGFPKDVIPGALVVTKEIDLASASLHKVLQEKTTLRDVKLEFWRMPPAGGPEENHFIMVLTDAQVASIRTVMLFNKKQDNSLLPEHELVTFTYKAIGFTYKGAEGSSNSGPFTRDKFDDYEDSIKDAITGSIKESAADFGKGMADSLKSALSELKGGGGGAAGGGI